MYDVMIYWINNQSCMQDLCTIGGARLPNDLETINSAYYVCEDRMAQDRLTADSSDVACERISADMFAAA